MTSSHDKALHRPQTRYVLPLLALAAPLLTPGVAFAGGYEYGTPGARAEGRGGAEYAATDSPTALYFNPANLARIDRVRLLAAGNMIFSNNCMRRELAELTASDGDVTAYDPEGEAMTAVPDGSGRYFLPEVCNDGRPSVNPQLGLTLPVMDGLTIGVGLFFPVAPQIANFGNESGLLDDGMTLVPTRYLQTEQDIIQAFPTVGVGYSPIDEIRFGVAFGWGISSIEFSNFAFSDLLASLGVPTPDARNELYVKDWFTPRVTASIAATPVRGLDLVASYTWVDDVEADGHLSITLPEGLPLPVTGARIDDVSLLSQQNWTLALGARYAKPLANPVGRVGDRLATEAWDIEVDFLVFGNERVDDFVVNLPDDATLGTPPLALDLPDELLLPHRWKTQYSVRIGGDYNIVPGILAARAGFSYESDGVEDGFEQLDFQPFRRFGLHVGGTVRLWDKVDVSAAYTHLFQQDIDNLGVDCLNTPDLVNQPRCLQRSTSAETPTAADLAIANAGRIDTSFNMLMLEATYTFGGPREAQIEGEEEAAPPPPPADEWEPAPGADVDTRVEPTPYPGDVPPPAPAPAPAPTY